MLTSKHRLTFLFCALLPAVWGQPEASLTITASRTISPTAQKPDQAVFGVNVASPLDTSLDDVVAALAGSGIKTTDLFGVNALEIQSPGGSQNCVPILQWYFDLTVPIANRNDTAALLTTIQQGIAKKLPGAVMNFGLLGLQVSTQSQSSQQCSITDLITDARTQAQKLAGAAGATVGPIVGISDAALGYAYGFVSSSLGFGYPGLIPPSTSYCSPYSSTVTGSGTTRPPGLAVSSPVNCAVVVKFSLLPSQ